jgi:hypothetical protein
VRRATFLAASTVPVGLLFNFVHFTYTGEARQLPVWLAVVENVVFFLGTAGLLWLWRRERS